MSELCLLDSELTAAYQTANGASLRGQRAYLILNRTRLFLIIAAAAAGVFTAASSTHRIEKEVFASAAVVAFLAAFCVEVFILARRDEELWYHGRAVAESAKTLSWRYAVGASPFTRDLEDADVVFSNSLKDVIDESPITPDLPPITGVLVSDSMRSLRQSSLADRKQAYIKCRIDNQANWYAAKAESCGKSASRWRIAMIAFELIGALCALLVLINVTDLVFDGIISSVIAAAAAWLELKQFDNLAEAYSLTATELTFVRSEADRVNDENGWSAYVNSAEQAISREHTMWLARRIKPRTRLRKK